MKNHDDSQLIQILIESAEKLDKKMDEQVAISANIASRLVILEKSLIGYKGFVGGMVFVASSLVTFFLFIFDRFKQ